MAVQKYKNRFYLLETCFLGVFAVANYEFDIRLTKFEMANVFFLSLWFIETI